MFIGHLPVGYLVAVGLKKRLPIAWKIRWKPLLIVALIGSVFPDIDLFYFYLIDGRQHHHHSYFTHYPLFWISVGTILLLSHRLSLLTQAHLIYGLVFVASVLIHCLLDTIVGNIRWLAPFSDQGFSFAHVTRRYEPWWLNFILHWTFIAELLVTLCAIGVIIYRRQKK